MWFDEFSDQFDNEYKKKTSINVLFAYQGVDPHLGLAAPFFWPGGAVLEGPHVGWVSFLQHSSHS